MGAVSVVALTAAAAPAAGRLLAASHAQYPAFRHLYPDPTVRRRVLYSFMVAAARDTARHGHGLGAHRDGQLVGVALWMPPGGFPPGPLRKVRMAPALAQVALVAPTRFAAFARSGTTLQRALPAGPVWYLQALGVHPDVQRGGVGTALVDAGLAAVDAAGLACHLHTSDPANVDYYRRWGFELTQPVIRCGEGGPTYYGMTRPPTSLAHG